MLKTKHEILCSLIDDSKRKIERLEVSYKFLQEDLERLKEKLTQDSFNIDAERHKLASLEDMKQQFEEQ